MDRHPSTHGSPHLPNAERPVVLLLGPAGSGKTAACLELHRRFQRPAGSGCILLTPNAVTASAMRRRVVAESSTGIVSGPNVLTFASLAGRILSAAGDRGRQLPAPKRLLLLRTVLDDLAAAGELSALTGVLDTPGIVTALDRAISEFKRAAIEPDALAAAVAGGADKHRDLLAVYRRYQQRLHEDNCYDVEGRMWQARDVLRDYDDASPALAGIEALAVDGFTDFTPTQLEMLSLLSRRIPQVLISLPHADDSRRRLWQWTDRTAQRLRDAMAARLTEIALPAPDAPALGAVPQQVFDPEAATAPPPKALSIVAVAGTEAEVLAAARAAKRLLLGGAPAGSIAVLARDLAGYRDTIDRIFTECDVPVAAAPRTLADEPVVRFLSAAATVMPRAATADVLRVIKSSYFRPQSVGEFCDEDVAAAEMIIREGNVLEGPAAYQRAAERLARRGGGDDGDEDRDIQLGPLALNGDAVRRAADLLARLFEMLQTAGEDLPALADRLQMTRAVCGHRSDQLVARDLRALAALGEVLADIDPGLGLSRIGVLLSAVTVPPARTESLVDVLDVLDARALRYDHVFLLGLGEGQFPRSPADTALVGEAERTAWRQRGVDLDSRSDLTAREMLLFYLAITRADKTLTLSYQHTDSRGGVGAPGAFVTAVLETAPPATRDTMTRVHAPGRFVPETSQITRPREAFNAAVAGLFDTRIGMTTEALAWAVDAARNRLTLAARGIWAQDRRWRAGPCDSFDGRISDPILLTSLASELFAPDKAFSASRLNTYGGCPWRFFARYVLRLAPLAQPQRRLEAVQKGLFCHRVLCRVFATLAQEAHGPVQLAAVGEPVLAATLAAAVETESVRVEAANTTYPTLWGIQRQQMQTQMMDYLRMSAANESLEAVALHFELAFGYGGSADDAQDPTSDPEPQPVVTPAGTFLAQGRIDRVDRVTFKDRTGLMVVDYKTGSLPTKPSIVRGQNLQLPLYIAVVEAMLDQPCLGGAFHRVGASDGTYEKTFAEFQPRAGAYVANNKYDDELAAALEQAGRFVAAIRNGQFDLLPTHACTYCDYRRICHYSPVRAQFKAPADSFSPEDDDA